MSHQHNHHEHFGLRYITLAVMSKGHLLELIGDLSLMLMLVPVDKHFHQQCGPLFSRKQIIPESNRRYCWRTDYFNFLAQQSVTAAIQRNLKCQIWPNLSLLERQVMQQMFYNCSRVLQLKCPIKLITFNSFYALSLNSDLTVYPHTII